MKALSFLLISIAFLMIHSNGLSQNPAATDSLTKKDENQAENSKKKESFKERYPFMDRVYFGGNVGAFFGSNLTIVELSPLVGYRVTNEFSAGVGITYIYMKDYYGPENIYGGRIFGRYQVFESAFAYAEYEVLDIPYQPLYPTNKEYRKTITSPMVGAGYNQSMGERAQFVIMGLWNLNQTLYSPYPNPIIRMGVLLGI
jgi:hypothetical protein